MGLFGEKTTTKTEPEGRGSSWTNGRALSGRWVSFGVAIAIAAGPAALVLQSARPPVIAAADTSAPAFLPATEQAAGSFALGYVGAWLGATKDDSSQLAQYVDVASVRSLSSVSWEYRDLAVVSIEPGQGGLVTVVVAANLKELASSDDGSSQELWPRRYFQVVVNSVEGALGVVGLPAPVAPPPSIRTVVALSYRAAVSPNDPLADSVIAFLNAYLAGSGDITRYSTPGTDFLAIDPAPFVSVAAIDMRADREPAQSPADGQVARILATVGLANVYDQRLTSTYALTLTARAGRWEITTIDLAPQENASTEAGTSTTPTSSPTGDIDER